MLSEHERRVLRRIEERTADTDPGLAAYLAAPDRGRSDPHPVREPVPRGAVALICAAVACAAFLLTLMVAAGYGAP